MTDIEQAPPTFSHGGDPCTLRQEDSSNWLLRFMHPDDHALLAPSLRRVAIGNGDRLAQAGAAIESVCFPEAGIAGFLDVLSDGRSLAVGLLGREGFTGWPLVMGNDRWPHEVVARGHDATALKVDAGALNLALTASARLRNHLLRYASTFMIQMSRTIVSNLIHSVEKRTARWLLLYHDRLDTSDLAITHEELGAMLGVRRASVTQALHQLEANGGIRGHRGRILIRDREALAAMVRETYGQAEGEYQRLLGNPDMTGG